MKVRMESLSEMKKAWNKKMEIRQAVLQKRAALSAKEVESRSERIKKCLYRDWDFKKADVIALYASFRNEVDTLSLIRDSLLTGKRVGLPRTRRLDRSISFYEIKKPEDLQPGAFGIPEPGKDCPELAPSEINLVIMPGVAFDETGSRIGFGGGYYDRFLKQLPHTVKKIALAYEFQMVKEKIPLLAKDAKIDTIITEERIITP